MLKALAMAVGPIVMVVTVTGSALAEDKVTEKVVIKKRTLIDFSDVNIEGELRKPDGLYFGSRKRTRFNKMIQVRPNFTPEIKASIDQL